MISFSTAISSVWKFNVRRLFAVLAFAFLAVSARAQGDSSLAGTVTDTSDAVVSGATIVIKSLETGTERTVVTDESGRFNAPALPVGHYEITAAKPGFQTDRRRAIALAVGVREEVDFRLQVGDAHQTVEVPEFSTILQV